MARAAAHATARRTPGRVEATRRPLRDAPPVIAPILATKGRAGFWLAVVLTGVGTGLAAASLTALLSVVQRAAWPAAGDDLLQAAARAPAWRHIAVLLAAGLLTGGGQWLLRRLPGPAGTDITEALWFQAGRLPARRTLGSAVLSVVIVGMGASLGREGAPKQAGAVLGNLVSTGTGLPDDLRRLLVACGAGAGMAAVYGVPLGGALFALEVLRGELALRFVVPALMTSLIATAIAWLFVSNGPTYVIPAYAAPDSTLAWALLAGPILGVAAVGLVRAVAWAEHRKPKGGWRLVAPVLALGALGAVSIAAPALLGNGRDLAQLLFTGQVAAPLVLALLLLKPAATVLCLGTGAPGGLFTPSLTIGALLGAALGSVWSLAWPGVPPGLFAVLGAAGLVAATTQGPVSTVVLMMELTGQARMGILPMLLVVAGATLVSRTIEARSIYDARLTDAEVVARQREREGGL